MVLKEILKFKLIETDSYSLSVYHLISILILFIAAKILLTVIKRLFKRQETKQTFDVGKLHAIFQIIKYIVWTIAILFMLDSAGIKITFILASSAALLVGVGLGLQQIFQDFISGIAILVEGTLKVGDIVQTESGEVGKVKEISLRTSKLETRDNIILILPNSKLINDSVINWSHVDKTTRFGVSVGVAYGSDVDKVTELLLKCAEEHKEIVKKPAPTVFFRDFGNSSLDFELLFYTNNTFRVERIKSDLRYSIDRAFRKNGITIPFPQRDVHVIPQK
ncbi:MAG: mechanosensitive ion channel [Bacteroidales bacterium]|nr:mechanosensitive ion channel [Bacteroidales bacterium]MBN2818313.1 mechanosensitive ion channel [Bacteroidales bacterium]